MGTPDCISTTSASLPMHSESSTRERFERRGKNIHQLTMLTQLLISCGKFSSSLYPRADVFLQHWSPREKQQLQPRTRCHTAHVTTLPKRGLFLPSFTSFSLSVSHLTNIEGTWLWCCALGNTELETTKSHFRPQAAPSLMGKTDRSAGSYSTLGSMHECYGSTEEKH